MCAYVCEPERVCPDFRAQQKLLVGQTFLILLKNPHPETFCY